MLIYSLLHLTGYDLPLRELKNFRQLHSKTAGHPEVGVTPGVETTTGPLGQGITNAVGMALAEKLLAAEFNRDGHAVVDHHTYVFLGDGCLMEGISHEACALAGAWKLNKLIAVYDDNGISIDGQVAPWFIDDTPARFRAYGWNVIGPIDGHDVDAVDRAIADARRSADKPTLIVAKTQIGKGSPNRVNTAKAHGEALGAGRDQAHARGAGLAARALRAARGRLRRLGRARPRARAAQADWDKRFAAYRAAHPELAAEFVRRMKGELPRNFAQVAVDAAAGRACEGRDGRFAQGLAAGAGGVHRRPAGDAGRLRRPHRLQPHQHQEHAAAALRPGGRGASAPRTARSAATSTTACASSAWRPS